MVEQGEISGSELERLRDAITIAFPTRQALARMLWFKLNEDLNRHVGEGALEDVVFDLLAWAETWGRIDALVKGALEAAPPERAEALRAFVDRRPALRRPRPAPAGLDFGGLLNDGTSALPEYKTPANLLNARHSVVPFYEPGRAALIDQLDDWINDRAPVSARLLHGEGGMGKTRLFIEMLSRRRAAGWAASGFVNARTAADRFAALSGSLVPALVVFDHAEGRHGLKDLLAIAAERRASRRAPLRIVLLARNDGDWWSQLRASEGSVGDLLADASAIELAPLARGSEERARVFGEAVQAFAWLLRKTTPRALPRLDHPLFDRTLYLHMAALALVEGLHVDAGTLIDEILSHEERFWRGLCDSSAGEIARRSFVDRLRAVVSTLTLFGGARGRVEAKALNERALGERDPTALVAARRLYPGRRAEQRYLGGLEPDLLGEGMVRRRLLG